MHIKRPKPHFAPKKTVEEEEGGELDFLNQEVEGRLRKPSKAPKATEEEEEEEGARPYDVLVEELKAALAAQDEYITELKDHIDGESVVQDGLAYISQTYREHRDSLAAFTESVRSLRDIEVQRLRGEIEALQVQVSVLEKEVKVYQDAFERVDKIKK
jgi:hypothetical protein